MNNRRVVTTHSLTHSLLTPKGQSTVEYAVLAAVVAGALLVMQIYMKRGISGKLKDSADQVGEQFTPYSATYSINKDYTVTARVESTTNTGGSTTSLQSEKRTRTGSEDTVKSDMSTETLWSKN